MDQIEWGREQGAGAIQILDLIVEGEGGRLGRCSQRRCVVGQQQLHLCVVPLWDLQRAAEYGEAAVGYGCKIDTHWGGERKVEPAAVTGCRRRAGVELNVLDGYPDVGILRRHV